MRDLNFIDAPKISQKSWLIIFGLLLGFLWIVNFGIAMDGYKKDGQIKEKYKEYQGVIWNHVGEDFANFWTAGVLAKYGDLKGIYNPKEFKKKMRKHLKINDKYDARFLYNAGGIMLFSSFADLEYRHAFFVFKYIGLALFVFVFALSMKKRYALLCAISYPSLVSNMVNGQNGFYCAFLLGVGLHYIKKNPYFSAICFTLLTFKPQFGILIPFLLLLSKNYRCFIYTTVGVLSFQGIASIKYGFWTWKAFFLASNQFVNEVFERVVNGYGWYRFSSVFASLRTLGFDNKNASLIYFTIIIGLFYILYNIFKNKNIPIEIKGAVLIISNYLVIPHYWDYDLASLAVAIVWLYQNAQKTGFFKYEKLALAIGWVSPFLMVTIIKNSNMPLSPLFFVLLLFFAVKRAVYMINISNNVKLKTR